MKKNKFRVWDRRQKKMFYSFNYLLSADGLLYWRMSNASEACLLGQDNFKTMFYIKKKDKNNKEIYDQDFVKYTRINWYCPGHPKHNTDLENICFIYWDDKKFSFCNHMRDVTGRVFSTGSCVFNDERADENIVEIIGNAFENPELKIK